MSKKSGKKQKGAAQPLPLSMRIAVKEAELQAKIDELEKRIDAERADAAQQAQRFMIVMSADALAATLNRELGYGAKRINKFLDEYFSTINDFAEEWNADTKDCQYSMDKIDRVLRPIYERAGLPFDDYKKRYKGLRVIEYGKASAD